MIKRSLLLFTALLLYLQMAAQQNISHYFREAYRQYPNIPAGTLEATAYAASHLVNLQPAVSQDNCMHMPDRFGIFALVEDGKGYFKNNLLEVCRLSNISPAQFKKNVRLQILAVAKFLSAQAGTQRLAAGAGVESFAPVLEKLSEIPDDGSAVNAYARSLYTYDIYRRLQQGFSTPVLKAAPVKVQLEKIYPAGTLRTLQAPGVKVDFDKDRVLSPANDVSLLSTDYGPALWDEAHTNNWGSRNGVTPTNVTIHTAQGSYAGTISWFNNGSAVVSAHYVVRSSDGQVTQMVREANRAYHVLNHNNYTIGIEHEGYVSDASWYTNNMYNSSAALVRDICSSWNIDGSTCFTGPATSGTNFLPVTVRVKGHQHYNGNTHTDPGVNWNWARYYDLINPSAPGAPTTITFTVKNQATGIAIAGASVAVTAPDGSTSTLQTNSSGRLVFGADTGRYTFAFTKSGYDRLQTFFVGGEETAITADINLDPASTGLTATDAAAARLKAAGTKMVITGYVRDADANTALAGVEVNAGGYTGTTDNNGFFSIAYTGAISAITPGKVPAQISIRAAKAGYVPHTIQNFYLIPETYTLKIALTSTASQKARQLQQPEELERSRHGMFDRTAADEQQRAADHQGAMTAAASSTAPVTLAAAAAAVPASIRVGTSCSCTTCSSVQVMSLEAYVQTGVDDEWISSWGAASLQAGAVAYRSYGAWYVEHPVKSNYDIASSTCNQAWESDQATSVKNAAIATAGIVLTRNGAIFRSEYSAENNNSGCGNGYSGTGSTWPCISDARCAGRTKNGHGRGMCQWGSSFWASDKTYQWILDHYYTPGGVSVQDPTPPAPTTITFTVKHQGTGNAVANTAVSVTAPDGTTASLQTDATGKLVFGADTGRYTFAFSKSGYTALSTAFTGGGDAAITANIHLDPAATLAAATAAATSLAAANEMKLTGYVSNASAHAPLAGVQVSAGMYTGLTDSRGFFSVTVPAAAAITDAKAPETIDLQFAKAGYTPYAIRHIYRIPDTYTLKVELAADNAPQGVATLQRGGTEAVSLLGVFDRTAADRQQRAAGSAAASTTATAPVTVAAIALPYSIRVAAACACTPCSDPVVEVMSLESYVATGVDDEWISSWAAASLQAGAVAYRSVGAWYVEHPVAVNYDVSGAACHQTWQPDHATSVQHAAAATKGVVLTKDGAVFRAEYSAENNNAGCGDGFSGNGGAWPCIADERCLGRTNNGDGIGVCQWGSSFWASDKTYQWILDHYYNPGGVDSMAITARSFLSAASMPTVVTDKGTGTSQLQIIPNPVTGSEVSVTFTSAKAAQPAILLLSDNNGRPVQQHRVALQQGMNRFSLQTGALRSGIYIVTLQLANGRSESKKLVLLK